MGGSCPHKPSTAGCRDAAGAAGHCGGCRGEDGGDDMGCGAAAGSHPAAGGGWSRAVPCCASPAPLQGHSTGRLTCVHPLPAPTPTHGCCCGWVSAQGQHIKDMALLFTPSHHSPKYPLAHPISTSPKPPATFCHSINQQLLFPPPWKKHRLPSCPAPLCPPGPGGTGTWRWDRPVLGPSVCPAAALLRALTSALPAAGRWAGGTAPIVLKIIQRSTNSLQISVTARRN